MKMSNGHGTVNDAFDNTEDDLSTTNSKPNSNGNAHNGTANGKSVPVADVEENSTYKDRPTWGNSIEFLLSCISMSVGLGNVWRFPFTAYENGGGAFLIPYIVVLFVIGKPMYYLEMTLGQFASRGSIKVWDLMPILRGVGVGQIIATASVLSYYCALIAITMHYLFSSFQSDLPWAKCKPEWPNCVDSLPGEGTIRPNGTKATSSSEYYFLNEVIKQKTDISDGIGTPDWQLTLYLLAAWVIIFLIIVRGVRSSGKASYFLALFPYVVLLILLVRAVTLEGAVDGIIFFYKPQWGELLNPKVWYSAVTQAFFSLNIGMGTIVMFSSYNKFKHNITRDAFIVTTLDTFTSLLAGTTIFAILGNLAFNLKVDSIREVVRSGAGLAFISYPDAIAKFTWAPQLFAVLFFIMLMVLGIGSAVALQSAINTVIWDQMPKTGYWKVAGCVSICGFLIGLVYLTPGGQWVLDLVDHFGGTFVIFALVIVEIIAICWIYNIENLSIDLQFMTKRIVTIYWRTNWTFLTPIFMSVIFVYYLVKLENPKYSGWEYPTLTLAGGWFIFFLAIAQVPIFAIIHLIKHSGKGFWTTLKNGFKPNRHWGPKNPKLNSEWLRFKDDIQEHRQKEAYSMGHSRLMELWLMYTGKYQRHFQANY